MKHTQNLRTFALYFGMFFLLIGMNSCSDDDDGDVIEPVGPTGSIMIANDSVVITDNVVVVDEVTISTDGWLVPRKVNTDQSFSAILGDPVMVQEGTTTDIEVELNNVNDTTATLEDGDVIVFLLHEDDGDGTFEYQDGVGEDAPIQDSFGSVVTETVVVHQPSVTTEDQSVVDGQVTVQNVNTAQPGWVVVYNDANGVIDETDIIGRTYVTAGSTDNVVIDLDDDFIASPGQNIYTRLHWDNPNDEVWTFEDDNTQDVPMTFGFDTDNTITTTSVLN